MDVRAHHPYVACERALERDREGVSLEFLLSLFALLSAFTGAFAGVREAEPRAHHAAAALAVVVEAPRAAMPAAAAASVAASFAGPAIQAPSFGLAFALAPSAPLETIRLLE